MCSSIRDSRFGPPPGPRRIRSGISSLFGIDCSTIQPCGGGGFGGTGRRTAHGTRDAQRVRSAGGEETPHGRKVCRCMGSVLGLQREYWLPSMSAADNRAAASGGVGSVPRPRDGSAAPPAASSAPASSSPPSDAPPSAQTRRRSVRRRRASRPSSARHIGTRTRTARRRAVWWREVRCGREHPGVGGVVTREVRTGGSTGVGCPQGGDCTATHLLGAERLLLRHHLLRRLAALERALPLRRGLLVCPGVAWRGVAWRGVARRGEWQAD